MSDQTGGTQFYSALQKKAMAAVQDILKTQLFPIQYPAQGDFMWNWQNINQLFNQSTFDYISARVFPGDVPGTAALATAGSFPNAYSEVLNNIEYSLGSAEQQKLSKAQSNASVQAGTIVSDYQGIFGPITDDAMQQAGVTTKQDYVISYILGSKWSGRGDKEPLSYTEMAKARNLKDLLPKAPMSSDQVVTDVTIYLNQMQPVNTLSNSLQNGAWVLRSLRNNTQSPTESNGGMKTVNPNTGAPSSTYQVGYNISSAIATISNDLQNKGRAISLSMETSQASGGNVSVRVEGQAGFDVGSWLQLTTSAGGSYDMSKSSGTSTDATVSISYQGYSVVPLSPLAWQQATDTNFYMPEPIAKAVRNGTSDVTGFKFTAPAPFTMGPLESGGSFGLLTHLLISNFPTITITYRNANFSNFKQSWAQNVQGNLTLFGFIKLGSFSQGSYSSSYTQGSDNSTFTVTFSQSPEVSSVPQLMKTAYVVGGAVSNPGVE